MKANESAILKIGSRVTAFPCVHGSGDFAWQVRQVIDAGNFDCVAVPLPLSFQAAVESAILKLPKISVVLQRSLKNWSPDEDSDLPHASYVPIDPCQSVIAAIRSAIGEHIPRRFIDLETDRFVPNATVLPDPYALKKVSVSQFAASVVPYLPTPDDEQHQTRIAHMAWQLKQLSVDFQNILFVCSVNDWPWIRSAFHRTNVGAADDENVREVETFSVSPQTLFFVLGELPFVTWRYELAREQLGDDANLSIDGVKELLLEARDAYRHEYGKRAAKITPHTLRLCLRYIRNLTLIEHRLTPHLATIVVAAQQFVGDGYAIHVLQQARYYFADRAPDLLKFEQHARMGIDQIGLPDDDILKVVSRLPGPPVIWTSIELNPKPQRQQSDQWKTRWNPYTQCSWPPEDTLIEQFRSTVFDRAKELIGQDLARTEKFTSSVMDGIDIRDTLRNWHEEQVYVKVLPPNRGTLDAAVMLFDSPADPRDYPWRTTWFAEHAEESTLAFFATDFRQEMVGPGIGLATYGGALFLYPPIAIADIWSDRRFDFATTLEERLLAAACLHARSRQIALLSPNPPGPLWRQIAKKFQKHWIHLPLKRFSDQTVQQLRMVHVLNGKQVRSYAGEFIRRM